VANTIGCDATLSGTPLSPPAAPALSRCHMSPWYVREQDGHHDARRLLHLTYSTSSGSDADEKVDSTDPEDVSMVCC
jgi:hypothetical protein